jgi:hypothetical protein
MSVAAVWATTAVLQGCTDFLGIACTDELRPSIVVEVRDSATGAPAARGATGLTVHETGADTELAAFDTLHLSGNWNRELPGDHSVRVRKPGFRTQVLPRVQVGEGGCHVETVRLPFRIARDPGAVPLQPVFLTQGPDLNATPASAGIQIYGDTVEVGGFVPALCRSLQIVAFRSGNETHVQVQASDPPLGSCAGSERQFKARYLIPPVRSFLLVTNGFGFPVTLFAGSVSPAR